jgi:subtilisin-like proprotein convertase family protein
MKRTHCIALAALALSVLAAVPDVEAQTKKVTFATTPLTPTTPPDSAWVKDINNNGQIVGYVSVNVDGTVTTRPACIWEQIGGQWVVRDLGSTAYFDHTYAVGINDLAQVTGSKLFDDPQVGLFYDDWEATWEVLPNLNCAESSTAAINENGTICGTAINGDLLTATIWERPDGVTWTATDLASPFESLQGRITTLSDLNDADQVIGTSRMSRTSSDYRAHVWQRDEQGIWFLQDLPGELPVASAVNNVGQIAGTHVKNGKRQPCIWTRVGTEWLLTDLSVYATGFTISGVADINDSGHIAVNGTWDSGGQRGALLKNGVLYNLSNYMPKPEEFGWVLSTVQGMNNQGQIIGTLYSQTTANYYTGFVMDTRAVTYSYNSTILFPPKIRDNSTASQSMTLTDNVTITDLNVRVTLTHSQFSDLKFELVGPDNVTRLLCNAGTLTGSVTSPYTKTFVFDDEGSAGSIVPAVPLSYYDSKKTKGKWTLKITDTVKNSKTGTAWGFTLDVMPQL